MTLMEAIEKFRERCENNPRIQEFKEKMKQIAEEGTEDEMNEIIGEKEK